MKKARKAVSDDAPALRNKNSVCLAGEFAVLSQLALRNIDANMTLGRTKGVDILVSNPRTNRMYRIEVKTKLRDGDHLEKKTKDFGTVVGGWMMNKKHEDRVDPSLFYCFVIIWKNSSVFNFFIVPSAIVAIYVKEQHELYLKNRKKQGRVVKDTDMRTFRIGFEKHKYDISTPTAEKYRDNWEFDS